jgi:uroporphyrinogen III methyltransferase/synthase
MAVHPRGFVYLVGAGPGDPRLITLRAIECLQQAEVVIHDRLLNPSVLTYAPQAEIIDAAQQPEVHPRPQDQITALLVAKALEGKVVVRLKGGDPLVFGRGGEEALALAAAGIPFKIVPGVTSATAVPTYAGIPITQRGVAASLSVVAGHNIDDASALDWPRIAHGADTLVFLMAVQTLPYIVERLLAEGRAPGTPVAVVERGTYPKQKTVTGTLGDIVARAAALQTPATIIVGEAVTLREKLRWFDRPDLYPLFGWRVLNTQPAAEAAELSRELEALGAEVLEAPTTRVGPPADIGALDSAVNRLRKQQAVPERYDWVVFASAEAVSAFMMRLLDQGGDARALGGVKLGAVGAATAAALRSFGLAPDFSAAQFTAPALAGNTGRLAQQQVLLLLADAGRPDIVRALAAKGAAVQAVAAYAMGPAAPNRPLFDMLKSGDIDAAAFFSPAALSGLGSMLGDWPLSQALAGVSVVCAGTDTARTALERGVRVDAMREEPTAAAVAAALVAFRGR